MWATEEGGGRGALAQEGKEVGWLKKMERKMNFPFMNYELRDEIKDILERLRGSLALDLRCDQDILKQNSGGGGRIF